MTIMILTKEQADAFDRVLVLARASVTTDTDTEACDMLEDFLANECEALAGAG